MLYQRGSNVTIKQLVTKKTTNLGNLSHFKTFFFPDSSQWSLTILRKVSNPKLLIGLKYVPFLNVFIEWCHQTTRPWTSAKLQSPHPACIWFHQIMIRQQKWLVLVKVPVDGKNIKGFDGININLSSYVLVFFDWDKTIPGLAVKLDQIGRVTTYDNKQQSYLLNINTWQKW